MATDNVIVLKGLGTAAGVPQEITGGHASGLVVGELAVNTTASAAANRGQVFLGVSHTTGSNTSNIALGDPTTSEYRSDQEGGIVWVGAPILDEDNMASDSAAHLATQQSVKAYVDTATASTRDIDALGALGGTGVAQGDYFLISDNGTEKKITASNLEDWIFGNVSGEIAIAAGGAVTIAGNVVDEANLKVSNGPTNGQFLSAQSGDTGGLTWATPSTGTATAMTVADESSDTTCFPMFVTAATGDLAPKSGSNLTFDSADGILGATTFSGAGTSLTGTAASLTVGSVTVSANNSTDETVYPLFADGATGSQGAETDTGLTYNPSTGVITATQFTGAVSGNATTATTATTATNVTASANNSTDETVYPTFVDGATGGQGIETDTGLTYNPSSGLLTIGGELDAASLDISGNADIDGTLEADAYTVDGTTLLEYIQDSVGAMFTSNTETRIAATYEDGDGTIDLVVTDMTANDNDDVSVANLKTRLAGGFGSNAVTIGDSDDVVTIGNDLTVTGDLLVSGDTVTVNTATLSVEDPLIYMANGVSGTPSVDIGLIGERGSSTNVGIIWDESADVWSAITTTDTGTTAGNVSISDYAAFRAGAITADDGFTGDVTGTADTATVATNVTASANNSTDETVYPTFLDGATGTQGIETDTGFTYNPSSGLLTIGGELDAASLDISGNADIDGTLEADAITVNGTALNTVIAGVTVSNATTAAVATTVTITDNESTDEDNAIVFTSGGDVDGGDIGLESDGTLTYNPSDSTLTTTTFAGALSGNATTATTATTATNVTASANNSTDETVYPTFVDGATGGQGIETDTGLTYNPSSGLLTTTTVAAALTGNASTATALANARTIGGTSFDGTANIAVNLAATATALANARTIAGVSFDGTANIAIASTNLSDTSSICLLTGAQTLASKTIAGGTYTAA